MRGKRWNRGVYRISVNIVGGGIVVATVATVHYARAHVGRRARTVLDLRRRARTHSPPLIGVPCKYGKAYRVQAIYR